MNLDQIETKCFILALFIRDDGERFLLGSRAYEFLDSQLHFTANAYQNDIVEVQGNDGVMLAGQVRRGQSQAFDGYIGDSSVDKSTIEQYRQNFLKFFRKNHYYKVVYIFTDGSAIQRRQGFIVEAPEVKELYQLFPQYHISMNFEDINYYEYKEDEDGQEIYGESATLKVATSATGGLIWEEGSETTLSGEGSNFTLNGTIDGNGISNVQLKGDTTQQTYSGKNLINNYDLTFDYSNVGASYTTLTTLPTGIRYKTTYIEGGPSIIFKLLDLTPYKNKVIRMRANFSSKGGISMVLCDSDVTTRNIVAETMTSGAEISYTVPNDLGNTPYLAYRLRINPATGNDTVDFTDLILTIDNADMTYEPYTGGIASPNPDYPQEVQVVTGEQTVTITDGQGQSQEYEVNLGKNLFDGNYIAYVVGGTSGYQFYSSVNGRTAVIPCEPNTTYTVSKNTASNRFAIADYTSYPTTTTELNGLANQGGQALTNITVTTHSDAKYLFVYVSNDSTEPQLQIEKGSTATTYAPYFEPIELCKIGDYQDYIYKSGDDWYVHKEIGKYTFTGSEVVGKSGNANNNSFYYASSQNTGAFGFSDIDQTIIGNNTDSSVIPPVYSSNFTSTSPIAIMNTSIAGITFNKAGSGIDCRLGFTLSSSVNTAQLLTTWLTANTPSVYYPIATPTDTQITNTALIAQLNALAGATTYDDKTVFTVTSENQLGILSLSSIVIAGGGVVWDNYGAEWEEGTGGGPTMIDVDSIDNVYPVWELKGPAVNPQISVLTTNTTLTYTGSITASQTLSIDMFNKTATLNGTSVIGNVSGDWVYLKPGINRVTYTTTNADAPDSTIWWQEIVG